MKTLKEFDISIRKPPLSKNISECHPPIKVRTNLYNVILSLETHFYKVITIYKDDDPFPQGKGLLFIQTRLIEFSEANQQTA